MSTTPPSRLASVAADADADTDGEASAVDADAIRAAFGRLCTALADVAATADRSVRARCPHRGVGSRCFYAAGCRNQVLRAGGAVCGGDARVRFDPLDVEARDGPTVRPRPNGA